MFHRIIHSLSAKLLLLFICGGVTLLLLVGVIIGKGVRDSFITGTGPLLFHYAELLEMRVGETPTQDSARAIVENTPVEIHFLSEEEIWSTTDSPPDPNALRAQMATGGVSTTEDGKYLLKVSGKKLLVCVNKEGYQLFFQMNQPQSMSNEYRIEATILTSIFATLVLIYYATKALIKPIERIQHGVKRIGAGDLEHRIVKRRNDELGDLADEVNIMADDIQGMLEAKRQMLLGISHELRSPITRSRIHLALMEDSDSKQEVEKDIIAMESMITELLESEKLSGHHVSLNLESVKLDLLVKEFVHREFHRKIKVMELDEIWAELDPVRIKLLLRNLLQNAIKHSGTRRRPTISLVIEIDQFCIYVSDQGSGIDPSHIPYLTEPFYRPDPSRQRKTGGYGLGLHLCKAIVGAYGGNLSITSESSRGTTIRCAFPYVV